METKSNKEPDNTNLSVAIDKNIVAYVNLSDNRNYQFIHFSKFQGEVLYAIFAKFDTIISGSNRAIRKIDFAIITYTEGNRVEFEGEAPINMHNRREGQPNQIFITPKLKRVPVPVNDGIREHYWPYNDGPVPLDLNGNVTHLIINTKSSSGKCIQNHYPVKIPPTGAVGKNCYQSTIALIPSN